jgi:hypothetical protein
MARSERLAEQLDRHWRKNLRPRLDGLTDEEYFWEPVRGCWSIRPHGTSTAPMSAGSGEWTVDFASPDPVPAPVTTIAWSDGTSAARTSTSRHSPTRGPLTRR